jgi:hypothetical protein
MESLRIISSGYPNRTPGRRGEKTLAGCLDNLFGEYSRQQELLSFALIDGPRRLPWERGRRK